MSWLTKAVQFVSAIPLLIGSLLLFAGIVADDMFGDFTTVMGFPLTLAGAALLVFGIGLAVLVRRIAGGSAVLDLRGLRRRTD